jgi:hypothetical protein
MPFLRTSIALALAFALTIAVTALPDSTRAAACRPGTFAHIPPECAAPGGAPGRALEPPSAGAFRGGEAGFHFGTDDCERVTRWAPTHRQERQGITFDYYWVWVRDGNAPSPMAFVCGTPQTVAGFSRGPGAAGASLPCPSFVHGRQTRHTRPDGAGWWVSARAGYSNVSGGFGHNRDGFWNYRFYNPHAGRVQARLFGACRLPPPGHS